MIIERACARSIDQNSKVTDLGHSRLCRNKTHSKGLWFLGLPCFVVYSRFIVVFLPGTRRGLIYVPICIIAIFSTFMNETITRHALPYMELRHLPLLTSNKR